MKLERILQHLKHGIAAYHEFLEEWLTSKKSTYTEVEIYIIRQNINNNFFCCSGHSRMIYYRKELLIGIVKKIDVDTFYFKRWMVSRFLQSLAMMALEVGVNEFFNMPIQRLNISEDLKVNLAFYRCRTLKQLFEKYADEDFCKRSKFSNIVAYRRIVKKMVPVKSTPLGKKQYGMKKQYVGISFVLKEINLKNRKGINAGNEVNHSVKLVAQ